jgi:hypothetical protein
MVPSQAHRAAAYVPIPVKSSDAAHGELAHFIWGREAFRGERDHGETLNQP